LQSVFLDAGLEKNVFLSFSDIPFLREKGIKRGDEAVIQITKESIGTKSAKATADISLPGRFLVHTPFFRRTAISRQITNHEERNRLNGIMKEAAPVDAGFIIRTEAEGHDRKDLIRDARYLMNLWDNIKKKSGVKAPALLYKAFGLVFYVVRELFTDDVERLVINSAREYRDILNYVGMVAPELRRKISLYREKSPLFGTYGIEEQITDMKEQKVPLPCGGSIVMEQTEALVSIDVNTGKFTRGKNQEETAFIANCEAAREIARQIRLRNTGGIIIVDFVDMRNKKHNMRLLEILKEVLKKDKAKTDVLPITRLGLLEMTRERKKESVFAILCEPCPYCKGSGMVFSDMTMYIKIKKELLKKAPGMGSPALNVFMHPRVAALFDENTVREISRAVRKTIRIRPDYKLHQEEYEIAP